MVRYEDNPIGDRTSQGGNGSWLQMAVPALVAAAGAVTKGGPKRQYKYNKKLAEDTNAMNKANSEWMLEQNKELRDEQRAYEAAYNSPAAQMQRYKDAGLNPHLIYGQGSSGNASGSMVQIGGMPGVNMGSVDASYPDVAGSFMGASQSMVNMDLMRARTSESSIRQQAVALQNEIAKTNPMLKPSVAEAVSRSMEEAAALKAKEANFVRTAWVDRNKDETYRVYAAKILNEVDAMSQKLGLNEKDLQIRNKILESKEFENAVREVQVKWLKDGEVSPEHIRQGLMLILQKMMR